jgi:hypothetical protein
LVSGKVVYAYFPTGFFKVGSVAIAKMMLIEILSLVNQGKQPRQKFVI